MITILKRSSRVSSGKFLFREDSPMSKHLLSVFVSCFLLGHLSAQVPQKAVADDYNSIFKTVKWRSIGPFRGGALKDGGGEVGEARAFFLWTTRWGLLTNEQHRITWR